MSIIKDLVEKLEIQTEEEELNEKKKEIEKIDGFEKLKLDKFLESSNIPKRYFKANMSDLNKDDITFIREKKFSILKGSLGVGKTYTVSTISINAFKKVGTSTYFLRCYQLKTMDIVDLKALIKKCETVTSLIVDDLGMIIGNQFLTELIASMFLTRIDDDLRTMITTNENLGAFKDTTGVFDDRIANKLMESFVGRIMDGDSRRVRAK